MKVLYTFLVTTVGGRKRNHKKRVTLLAFRGKWAWIEERGKTPYTVYRCDVESMPEREPK